jgi:hypothetical protein
MTAAAAAAVGATGGGELLAHRAVYDDDVFASSLSSTPQH